MNKIKGTVSRMQQLARWIERHRVRAAAVTVAAAAVSVALAMLSANPAASEPTPQPGLTFGVHDPSNGSHMTLQANSSADNYGAFTIAAPTLGVLWGTANATMSGASPILQLRYDGVGYQDPQATLDQEFGDDYTLSGASQRIQLTVVGQINTATHQGVINFWVNGTHYQLNAGGSAAVSADPNAVARAYVAALLSHDAGAIYDLMDTQTQGTMTRATFTSTMAADPAFSTITSAAVLGQATVSSTDSGVVYATVDFTSTNGDGSAGGKLTLTWEVNSWRVYGVR